MALARGVSANHRPLAKPSAEPTANAAKVSNKVTAKCW